MGRPSGLGHRALPDSDEESGHDAGIELSVVVPVYNQADSIAENIEVIRESVAAGLGGATELIVVSDGSIDDTQEQALAASDERTASSTTTATWARATP